jgi:DNA helicase-2/ATP-dependent DNA helicase PcrA
MNLLGDLNSAQQEAVCHGNTPLLVLAGAGSGKTRVIVHRIAYLITELDISSKKIIAVTFTNKAAEEMEERVERLLGTKPEGMWIGTFHSVCTRILRRDGNKLGLSAGFTIYDREDSLGLLRTLVRETVPGITPRETSRYLEQISSLKAELVSPEEASGDKDREGVVLKDLYAAYQDKLLQSCVLDFDDIIMKAVELMIAEPRVLKSYQSRFSHILVDEYQDTNYAQYRLVSLLTGKKNSLFVVGDDDQSIYGWRGADIRNILEFEKDFPDAGSVILDVNYRSTGTILDAASSMISHNRERKPKKLRAEAGPGEKITVYRARDDRDEAKRIVASINRAYIEVGFSFGDFAVLYRTNAQSRVMEEVLRGEGIPYRVVGSLSFYRRKEIKDLLAYLKLAVNPADSYSLHRVINVPPRGIGEKTVNLLRENAGRLGVTAFEALFDMIADGSLKGARLERLRSFGELLQEVVKLAEEEAPDLVIREVLDRTGYINHLKEIGTAESRGRLENIEEFVRGVEEYVYLCRKHGDEARLVDFLEKTSLMEDTDDISQIPGGVSLLTLHNAKGLEFPFVFITGLEEGLLPWTRDDAGLRDDVEEERRLFYVGMTRARTRLHLSCARQRLTHGKLIRTIPSRFIREIPQGKTDEVTSRHVFKSSPRPRLAGTDFDSPVDGIYSDPAIASEAFSPGERVFHADFGGGVVTNATGWGDTLKITVDFDDVGTKKLYPLYANLRRENELERGSCE